MLKFGLKYFFDVFNTNGRIGKRGPFLFFKEILTSQIDNINNKMSKNEGFFKLEKNSHLL